MGRVLTNTQRAIQYAVKGEPTLALEFDVFADGEVSMWTHTRHDVPFTQMEQAFQAIQRHLSRFIAAKAMCPFHPAFGRGLADETEAAHGPV